MRVGYRVETRIAALLQPSTTPNVDLADVQLAAYGDVQPIVDNVNRAPTGAFTLMPTPQSSGRLRLPYLPAGSAIGFLIATVAVLVVAAFSFTTLQSTDAARQRVTRAVNVLDGMQTLLSALQNAETGQRGFLLTGDERYLDPYTSARAALPGTAHGAEARRTGTNHHAASRRRS